MLERIQKKLMQLQDPEKAKTLQRFFKTGPGQYGAGDIFWGIPVPELRKLVGIFKNISENTLLQLLASPVHEHRLLSLLIMVRKFEKGDKKQQKRLYELYMKYIQWVNSWDLVDTSAGAIVGAYLMGKSKAPLYRLARSKNLWERRIAILATFCFIKQGEFSETLSISKMLLSDNEDLIHKAVGWMLREVGKRDSSAAESFLKQYYHGMPRTMLRYAIEKFPPAKRQQYLKGEL